VTILAQLVTILFGS